MGMWDQWGIAVLGLNRTSVGLKLPEPEGLLDRYLVPQSNQRGIETICGMA